MLVDPRVAGLVVGYGADLALGDPRRGHPVAAFGPGREVEVGDRNRAVRLSARVGLGSVPVATGLAQRLSRSGRGGSRG